MSKPSPAPFGSSSSMASGHHNNSIANRGNSNTHSNTSLLSATLTTANSSSSKPPSNSFRDYQSHVRDAWNIDDADELFPLTTTAPGSSIVSTTVSQQAARLVLERHSRQAKANLQRMESSESSLKMSSHFPQGTTPAVPMTTETFSAEGRSQRRPSSSSQGSSSSNGILDHSTSASTSTANHAAGVTTFKKTAPGVGLRLSDCHYSSVPPSKAAVKNEAERLQKFNSLIQGPVTDLKALRNLSWYGVPVEVRHTVWKLLVGYLPPSVHLRQEILSQKRSQYFEFVQMYYKSDSAKRANVEMRNQIQKDLLRMSALHEKPKLQRLFERILCIWSLRHPASGYVQGINDLVMPFFVVFLSEYIRVDLNTAQELIFLHEPTKEQLRWVEADSYWCVSTLLDGVQDRYTFAQPGIQRAVSDLSTLINRTDKALHDHLTFHKVEYLQFAFRWMNNLLMRELPLRCIIRLWDTYQSEPQGFSKFHVYVCAGLLLHFVTDLKQKHDFQNLMIFLQNLPTCHWTDEQVNLILAVAFQLQSFYAQAPSHLASVAPP